MGVVVWMGISRMGWSELRVHKVFFFVYCGRYFVVALTIFATIGLANLVIVDLW